jgi:hypothetical protein
VTHFILGWRDQGAEANPQRYFHVSFQFLGVHKQISPFRYPTQFLSMLLLTYHYQLFALPIPSLNKEIE